VWHDHLQFVRCVSAYLCSLGRLRSVTYEARYGTLDTFRLVGESGTAAVGVRAVLVLPPALLRTPPALAAPPRLAGTSFGLAVVLAGGLLTALGATTCLGLVLGLGVVLTALELGVALRGPFALLLSVALRPGAIGFGFNPGCAPTEDALAVVYRAHVCTADLDSSIVHISYKAAMRECVEKSAVSDSVQTRQQLRRVWGQGSS
jgi:hypothetical protein